MSRSFRLPAAEAPAAVTDRDGRFTITGVGRDRIATLRLSGAGLETMTLHVATVPGFDPKRDFKAATNEVPLAQLQLGTFVGPEFTAVVAPGRVVRGVVKEWPTGKPVAGVRVGAQGYDPRTYQYSHGAAARTDARGRYELAGLRTATSYALTLTPDVSSDLLSLNAGVEADTQPSAVTADFNLPRGVVINGRVGGALPGEARSVSLQSLPLAGNRHVVGRPGDGPYFGCQAPAGYCDANGRFRLVSLPGPVLVVVSGNRNYLPARLRPEDAGRTAGGAGVGFATASNGQQVLAEMTAYRLLDLPDDARTAACDLELRPGKQVRVEARAPDGGTVKTFWAAFKRTPGTAEGTLISEGDFFAQGLDPERPRVVAFICQERLAGSVRLTGTEPSPVVVRLRPCAAVTGRLVDGEGRAVADVLVRLHVGGDYAALDAGEFTAGGVMAARTDRDGRFRIAGVIPDEEQSLSFTRRNLQPLIAEPAVTTVRLPAGGSKDLGTMRVKPFGG